MLLFFWVLFCDGGIVIHDQYINFMCIFLPIFNAIFLDLRYCIYVNHKTLYLSQKNHKTSETVEVLFILLKAKENIFI